MHAAGVEGRIASNLISLGELEGASCLIVSNVSVPFPPEAARAGTPFWLAPMQL